MVYKSHIELDSVSFDLIKENFVVVKVKDNIECNLEAAIKIHDVTYDLVQGKPFVILIDARDIHSNITPEARNYIATNKKISNVRKAQAIIVNNLHTKMLANFYMNFHGSSNPVKIFGDYNEATEWLEEIRSNWYK